MRGALVPLKDARAAREGAEHEANKILLGSKAPIGVIVGLLGKWKMETTI